MMTPLNPVLRWAGSKRKLLSVLRRSVSKDFNRYIEPFAGSACLFFALRPKKAILGDINEELIHFYNMLKFHPKEIFESVNLFDMTERAYYNIRAQDPILLGAILRASRFLYLNRQCFNGIYRTNKKGKFNVPFGKKTGNFPSKHDLLKCSNALSNADLFSGDYIETVNSIKIKKDDFFYLDPPYVTSAKNMRGEYGSDCFAFNEFPNLIDILTAIDEKEAKFLLSYIDSSEIRKYFNRNWRVRKISVKRNIAGFSCHRGIVNEILVSNY